VAKGLDYLMDLFTNKKMFRSKDDVPTSGFSEKTGPITIEDMMNIPEDELRKIRRTQELGLYDETPEILKAGNLFERFTKKVGGERVIDYDRAEFILNKKLKGNETLNDLLQIEYQTRPRRADGGRIGFSKGKGVDLLRRGFLKTMGAAGAGIAALKSGLLGLGGKQATKEVAKEIITTPAAAGKPAWFDALVTRVIREGDDVTKTMATKDREIVYRKKIDDETEVVVTQDLDEGVTRIDIDDSTRNVMGYDDPPTVSLQVTDEIVEEGGARIKPEFKATENDYRNYATDPDGGYDTEFVENTVEEVKDLTSDLTKVKSFATKKGPTMEEIVISKQKRDNVKYANENPSAYAADRGPQYDPSDYIDDMADDYASGGIARMIGE
jgi:hypothetical protein